MRLRRFGPLLSICLALVVAASACGAFRWGDDRGPRRDRHEPEVFTGTVDEFYVVPDPLPAGRPGDLIRIQALPDAPAGEVGLRIMYRSTDAEGDDRAVTGTVYFPTARPPRGGWPVLASAHGTSGLSSQCAPSRWASPPAAYGVEGVRVATDYIGLGPVGELHPYLNAAAEGHAVIDSVRAVSQLRDAGAGREWVVVGHSQGGHAALVTGEMAEERLPRHELLGTVAIAPGAQLGETYGDEIQTRIITAMVLLGAAAEDPSIDPAEYLNPGALEVATAAVETSCIGDIINRMIPVAIDPNYYLQHPLDGDLGGEWLAANDPGQVASDSPILLISGGLDAIVVPARTQALYERLCGVGQVTEFLYLPDATHDTEPAQAADHISSWLAGRLAGDPAPDTCAAAPTG